MPRTFRLAVLAAGALVALALSGCGRDRRPVASAGGTLVAATLTDLQGVNELVSADNRFTGEILEQLFPRLLEEQPDFESGPPSFAPRLAESWVRSADGREIVFRLREGLTWSDGVPLTAEDVRFTYEAQTSPAVAWSYAHVKDAIESVDVLDPRTVRFRFREVYATQLLDANEGGILPKHVWGARPFASWRENADWFRDHLVVSGPFRLASWRPAQEIVLERNPRYFEPGLPRLDRVVFRVVPDQGAQLAQLQGGGLDFVLGVPPARATEIEADPALELLRFWNRQYDYVAWNTRRPLFADPAVRRALTLGIDRQGLVDALWYGQARPAVSPVLSTSWAFKRGLEPWPYDPAEAGRLLEAAGWVDRDGDGVREKEGRRFAFDLVTNAGNRVRVDAAVMIQAQLARVGIEVRPRPLDLNTLNERALAHEFDAILSGWGIDTSMDLRFAFHSEEAEGGYNFGGYANPEVDRLIDSVRRQADLEAAKPLFDRLQEILHEEQPYTLLWEPRRLAAARSTLRDAQPNALATFFRLEEWWLAPPP
ncbi:MAG: ABC transporter substrate-binding protein [Thermoanaerobaculia bacterium]|nr:ABC transporter substrate-binding protein [Thermoanaerobaculia bacterium]